MMDRIGLDTFLRTGSVIIVLAVLAVMIGGYLRPALRLWMQGKAQFPALGASASALLVALSVVGIGYVYAYKPTHPAAGPTNHDRERQAAERDSRPITEKSVSTETLGEKADRMTHQSRQENDQRKEAFLRLPDGREE